MAQRGRQKVDESLLKTQNVKFGIDKGLHIELQALCFVLRTDINTVAKDLLVGWRTAELKKLKESADYLYEDFIVMKNKPEIDSDYKE